MKVHEYQVEITWTGNSGKGTKDYKAYERDHIIRVNGKPEIAGTSEVSYFGNKTRYNPEEMLVASLSACHMLWFLHLCSVNHIVVTSYTDKATGNMQTTPDGGGHFTEVILHPEITIAGMVEEEKMQQLQHQANKLCFIASSCNFPVVHKPVYSFT